MSFNTRTGLIIAALVGATAMTSAHAAENPIEFKADPIMLDKVVTVAGKTTHTLVSPAETHDKVVPGSHLVLSSHYRNLTNKPVEHFTVVNPLPAPLVLIENDNATFDVSVDHGKTFGKLSSLTFVDAHGNKRAAQLDDVTTLRWIIPLIAPGQSGELKFRAAVR